MDNIARGTENAHKLVYVTDLPKTTTYLDLIEFYESKVGPCQVNIKRTLFKPFYYAFVMFEQIEDAKKACEEHRFPRIKDGKMSRALAYNNHAVRGEAGGKDVQSTSIFVKGFEKVKWTHEDMYAKFCEFGKILSCKVSVDAEHNFLGFGYIQFSKIEEAQKAIEKMDKYDLSSDGYDNQGTLSVLEYQGKKPQVQAANSKKSFNNVYVKNFSRDPDFTDEQLWEIFREFGEIQNASVQRDSEGKSLGFGFVCFKECESAENACKSFKDRATEKRSEIEKEENPVPFVCEAKKKDERSREVVMNNFKYKKSIMYFSLFVKNFPIGTTEDELKIYFNQASQGGEISKITFVEESQQAFINFEKQDSCKLAKEFVRNSLFKHQYALYAEYCYPKEMRVLRNEENIDKKTMDRRKQDKQQQLLNNQSGANNLIELLTMLLKPNLNQGHMQQRRSHSVNNMMQRGPNPNYQGGGNNHQMNNNHLQNQRGGNGNFQHRGRNMHNGGGGNYHQQRNMSQNVQGMTQGQTPQMANQNQMMPQPQPNMAGQQSMVSGVSSAGSSMVNNNPAQAQYGMQYNNEIQAMFISPEFKNIESKKDIVGNTIYKHVEKIVGDSKAPKITGMLIDLPEAELNYSISNWTNFMTKVQAAYSLITESENRAPSGAQGGSPDQQVVSN